MNSRQYTYITIFCLFGLLVIISVFNALVDPFWYFGFVNVPGFNSVKPVFRRFEREVKPAILVKKQPEAVIFGSSISEIGFDPLNSAFTDNGSLSSYNFAMKGAPWDVVFCNVIFALNHARPKRILLGIDTVSMPIHDCTSQFIKMERRPWETFLLSIDTLKASVETLIKQKKKQHYTEAGMFFFKRYDTNLLEARFVTNFRKLDTHRDGKCLSNKLAHIETDGFPSIDFHPPYEYFDMDGLHYLLKKFAMAGVTVKLFVYPTHALGFEYALLCTNGMERWKRLWYITKIINEVDYSGSEKIELWDFQGYSSYLTEKINNSETKYWQDPIHFNYEMGNIILDVMFSKQLYSYYNGGEKFGVRLAGSNIFRQVHDFNHERRNFLQANPWFLQSLRNLTGRL